MVNIGTIYNTNVGMMMYTNVGINKSLNVGSDESASIGKNKTTTVGDTFSLTAGSGGGAGSNITMDATSITLTVGKSQLTLKEDGTILLNGNDYAITLTGEQTTKADGNIVLKGAKILEN
jgi:type VI secretion system secreted protein VgrG